MKTRIIITTLAALALTAGLARAEMDSGTRTQLEIQRSWERMLDRQQRERFHEDYEADRRTRPYVNPDGRDAQGAEVDGDDGD
jgi:hypothetical protein